MTVDPSGLRDWTMTGDSPGLRISWPGRAAVAVFAVNTVLLFFPPIPPYVKGSLWAYLLKTTAVVLAMLQTHRLAVPVATRWAGLRSSTRWLLGLGSAALLLTFALALRAVAPDLSDRFSSEPGPWETITTACYACGLVLVWRIASTVEGGARGHLRLVAGGFALLVLEETDYAGVLGGLVGRVDGVYVGSLHDLINLAAEGALHPLVGVGVAAAMPVVAVALWRAGYARPRLIGRTILSADGAWLALGFLILVIAGLGEAGMLGASFAGHSPEEAIEMAGGVCIAVFALQVAARHGAPPPK